MCSRSHAQRETRRSSNPRSVGVVVVGDADEVVREVLLGADTLGLIMRVPVPLAVAKSRSAGIPGPAQVGRDGTAATCPEVGDRRIEGEIGGIRLRGDGHVDDGLGQDDPRLRHPDLGHRVGAATAVWSAVGSAMPTSSEAARTTRRAMNRGSSPPRASGPGSAARRRRPSHAST